MSDKCNHGRGDFIQGIWICADCFTCLNGRPTKYGIELGLGLQGAPRERQTITWRADIARNDDGVTFAQFIGWMVSYLRLRSAWSLTKDEARRECLQVLCDQGEPFGSLGSGWDKDDAKELVNEAICAYWDESPSGANT